MIVEEYDRERTDYQESKGYKVMPLWKNDVLNDIQGVLHVIDVTLRNE